MEEELKSRKTPKRLLIDISEEEHFLIKEKALFRNITMRKWIMRAIKEQLKKEQAYE
mgnify:CR=1 FL=1